MNFYRLVRYEVEKRQTKRKYSRCPNEIEQFGILQYSGETEVENCPDVILDF